MKLGVNEGVGVVSRAPTNQQQTDKHKLVTHNLGDIGKVRGSVSSVKKRSFFF